MVIFVLTLVCALKTCIFPWAYSHRENTCLQGTYSGQYKINHVIIYKYFMAIANCFRIKGFCRVLTNSGHFAIFRQSKLSIWQVPSPGLTKLIWD